MKTQVMWAVMVNDEVYPDSLCAKREWAETYLGDAKHAAAPKANVRVVKVTIEEVKQTRREE